MKLCVMIHSPLPRDKTIRYAKQRAREGSKIIYLSSGLDTTRGLIALSELTKIISPKNLVVLFPRKGKLASDFDAYKTEFKKYLRNLKLKPRGRVVVEFVGGSAKYCFKNISKLALEEIIRTFDPRFRNLFGKEFERKFKDLGGSKVVAHTLLPLVFGGEREGAFKPPAKDFRKSALRVNRKSVRRRAP